MAGMRDEYLRSIEAAEAKASANVSPSLRRAYLDLAAHYRSRLKNGHEPLKA